MNLKRVFLLFWIAVLLAIFEIQIEGSAGWAKNLPCWRASAGSWQQEIYGAIMNDKPCDGFHLSEIALLLLMFHLPFVYGAKWTPSAESESLAGFFLMAICWDFLWFIFNPAYGWSNFNAQQIWWHIHWIGPFPKDYYGGLVTVSILAVAASQLAGKENFWPTLARIAKELGCLICLTAITAVVSTCIRAV